MQTVASVRVTVGEERDASGQPASGAERAAFNDFYVATRDDVYRTVLVATRHPQRAEDAVHEAYTRALAAWDRIAPGRGVTLSEREREVMWLILAGASNDEIGAQLGINARALSRTRGSLDAAQSDGRYRGANPGAIGALTAQ